MLSPYRSQPNVTIKRTKYTLNTHFDNNPHGKHDLKGRQMTSNHVVKPETNTKSNTKNKNILKAGSVHGNIGINDEYSDENLHNKNSQMELAMQIISNDKTVRSDTIQDLTDFNSRSLTSQAKKGEQLVSMTPAIKRLSI